MSQRVLGYVRISSRDQSERRQIDALEPFHIPRHRLYIDIQSGKDFKRPAYRKMIRHLREGDLLIVKSIDRLGRNYAEIMEQWRVITKEIGADIRVIDMPLLDTTKSKDLLGTFISDIVLQLLSFVAENERMSIRQRQAEGIAAAKARGVKFGRPRKPLPPEFPPVAQLWRRGLLSSRQAALRLGVSQSTFLGWVRAQGEMDGVNRL